MRAIKFRAWDTEKKTMCADFLSFVEEAIYHHWGNPWDDARFALMQFTGLLDKNGVEIFEGDILCIDNEEIAETVDGYSRYEPDNIISDVYYHHGSFRTKAGDFNLMADEYGESEKAWEVIGNICENPELRESR